MKKQHRHGITAKFWNQYNTVRTLISMRKRPASCKGCTAERKTHLNQGIVEEFLRSSNYCQNRPITINLTLLVSVIVESGSFSGILSLNNPIIIFIITILRQCFHITHFLLSSFKIVIVQSIFVLLQLILSAKVLILFILLVFWISFIIFYLFFVCYFSYLMTAM